MNPEWQLTFQVHAIPWWSVLLSRCACARLVAEDGRLALRGEFPVRGFRLQLPDGSRWDVSRVTDRSLQDRWWTRLGIVVGRSNSIAWEVSPS